MTLEPQPLAELEPPLACRARFEARPTCGGNLVFDGIEVFLQHGVEIRASRRAVFLGQLRERTRDEFARPRLLEHEIGKELAPGDVGDEA